MLLHDGKITGKVNDLGSVPAAQPCLIVQRPVAVVIVLLDLVPLSFQITLMSSNSAQSTTDPTRGNKRRRAERACDACRKRKGT
jgi:hypothetical protein